MLCPQCGANLDSENSLCEDCLAARSSAPEDDEKSSALVDDIMDSLEEDSLLEDDEDADPDPDADDFDEGAEDFGDENTESFGQAGGDPNSAVPEAAERKYQPAGFLIRTVALFVDGAVVYTVQLILSLVLVLAFQKSLPGLLSSLLTPQATDVEITSVVVVALVATVGFAFIYLSINFVIGWLYFAILECSSMQATVGKKLMGLIVTDLEEKQANFLQTSARHFCKGLFLLPLFIGVLTLFTNSPKIIAMGLVMSFLVAVLILIATFALVALTAQRQGLHDMFAGCFVGKKEDVSVGRVATAGVAAPILLFILAGIVQPSLGGDYSPSEYDSAAVDSLDENAGFDQDQGELAYLGDSADGTGEEERNGEGEGDNVGQTFSAEDTGDGTVDDGTVENETDGDELPTGEAIAEDGAEGFELDPSEENKLELVLEDDLPPGLPKGLLKVSPNTFGYSYIGGTLTRFQTVIALYYPQYNRLEVGFYAIKLNDRDKDYIAEKKFLRAIKERLPKVIVNFVFDSSVSSASVERLDSYNLAFYNAISSGTLRNSSSHLPVERTGKKLLARDIRTFSGPLTDGSFIRAKIKGYQTDRLTERTIAWAFEFDAPLIEVR